MSKGNQPQEGFQRPNHPDFMTSSELKNIEFTGSRANSITGDIEFWFFGEIKAIVTAQMREADPSSVYKAHKELFKL